MRYITRVNRTHPFFAWQRAVARAANEATFQPDAPAWRGLPLDVAENDEALTITAALPGFSPDDVEIAVHDGVLTIKAETMTETEETEADQDSKYYLRERYAGSFHRAVRLPVEVEADKAAATFENGLLTLTLPKVEAAQPKRIPVTVG